MISGEISRLIEKCNLAIRVQQINKILCLAREIGGWVPNDGGCAEKGAKIDRLDCYFANIINLVRTGNK